MYGIDSGNGYVYGEDPAVEAAYQRRLADRLEQRIAAIEARLGA